MAPLHHADPGVSASDIEAAYAAFLSQFKSIYPEIPAGLLQDFREMTSVEKINKGTVILDYGVVSRKCLLIYQGFVISWLMYDGIEKPIWFIGPGEITLAVESYIYQIKCREKLTAVEDTIAIVLDQQHYQQLCNKHVAFKLLTRELFLKYLLQALSRIELLHCDPEERYEHLLKTRPDIIMNAKISELAKYLGIARETLSRKRAELMKSNK